MGREREGGIRTGDSANGIRVFIAVPISEELRTVLEAIQRRLREAGGPVGWVRPDLFHITLRFLGDIDEGKVAGLSAMLDEAASSIPPGNVECVGIGTFGTRYGPSVIWAGCSDPDGTLGRLFEAVESGLDGLGFPEERRVFHPHITLGRVRRRRGAPRELVPLTSAIDSHRSAALGGFRAEAILLVQSRLSPGGAIYTTLHRSDLKGEDHARKGPAE